jgi:hypothetical protein
MMALFRIALDAVLRRVKTVSVRYSGPPLTSLGLKRIMVDLEYSAPDGDPRFDQRQSLLITDGPSTHAQEWQIRLSARTAMTYRWRTRLFFTNGNQTWTAFQLDSRAVLPVQAPVQ